MKRLVIFIAALILASSLQAQPEPAADSSQTIMTVDLGLSAGVSTIAMGKSPYQSPFSFKLQLPLMAHWELSPRFRCNAGLRYDFEWAPLRYNVQPAAEGGIEFLTTAATGRQTAVMNHRYLGIPVEVEWFPNPQNRRQVRLGFDLYAAYAVSRYLKIHNRDVRYTHGGVLTGHSTSVVGADDPSLLPWKLEVGVKVGTDLLGMIHGVRLFADLLPLYQDPATGEKIRTFGMTIFL